MCHHYLLNGQPHISQAALFAKCLSSWTQKGIFLERWLKTWAGSHLSYNQNTPSTTMWKPPKIEDSQEPSTYSLHRTFIVAVLSWLSSSIPQVLNTLDSLIYMSNLFPPKCTEQGSEVIFLSLDCGQKWFAKTQWEARTGKAQAKPGALSEGLPCQSSRDTVNAW